MKLALVRRQFSAAGGAELYAQRLLGALVDAGHDVHLLAEQWSDPPPGVEMHPLRVGGGRATRPARFADAAEAELARAAFDCVLSLERTRRQDVYRAGDGVHRVWLQRRRQFAPWWRRPFIGRGAFHRNVLALERNTFDPARTRRVIVNSDMVRREILAHFDFPVERIHLVRNGVDVARFQHGDRAATRARFGVKDNEFLLLFVGSGWERKGLKFLLQAMRLLPLGSLRQGLAQGLREFRKASAEVAGELAGTVLGQEGGGETERSSNVPADKVKLLVVGKGKAGPGVPGNVIFAGERADVENAFAAADLFAFLPIYEPSANVCAEALAARLPVLTSAQNGAAEWIEEGRNGTVLPNPTDVPAILRAIDYWWSRRFAVAVPDLCSALSLERNVSETLAVLELAAKERRA